MRRGSIALMPLVVLVGCGGWQPSSRVLLRECREVPREASHPSRIPEGPRPIHPDFAKLRAYRHYFALRKIGPYVHHFAVHFNCIEQSVDCFAVDDAGRVTSEGGAWGGLAGSPRGTTSVPDAMRAHAERARKALDDAYENESIQQVQYLGSYRKVVVEEMLPVEPPGDRPSARPPCAR